VARLLHDRYYEYAPDRAWDLLTGKIVPLPANAAEVDHDRPSLSALIELLDHGQDGAPRWMVVQRTSESWRDQAEAAATDARRRGYVAMGVDVFLRIRVLMTEEISTRALMLIARPGTPPHRAATALLYAAALSPRPHLLVICCRVRLPASRGALRRTGTPVNTTTVPPLQRASTEWRAAEARAAYGSRPLRLPTRPVSADVAKLIERSHRANDFVRAGRHASAERLLREVSAALVRRGEYWSAASTYIELGQLLLERGNAQGADAAFADAAAHAEQARSTVLASARVWQAAARTDAGQLSAAESLCRAALLTGQLDGAEQARAEATLARVLLWQGRSGEARALSFVDAGDASTPPFAAATAVRVLIECGEIFDAGRRARDLLTNVGTTDPIARVIALGAHLRVLTAAGDLTLATERLGEFAMAARAARSPLRLTRMRLLLVHALRRGGRRSEADMELRTLLRMRAVAPPLLRNAIDRCAKTTPTPNSTRVMVNRPPADAAQLVMLAQHEDDDGRALSVICEFLLRTLSATRVEVWTADAGPATTIVSAGAGVPTRLGGRALEAGIVIGPEPVEAGCEIAAPVRLGSSLMAAVSVRWPADRVAPEKAAGWLTLACAVAAPRVESMLHAKRLVAAAATSIPELVGVSASMAEVRRSIVRAAGAPFSVLIEGESGVGKELVARAIHQSSPRRDRRFCDVNCAALPDDLFESELFGHVRGAFTGAVIDRGGLVEDADGGTLFLDEVADLSARAQAKLLRVVQQQEVRRIGETFSRKVDVRFVSAANRDLRSEAAHGRFRSDLLYRLDVIRIHIPALRERPEDIPLLVHHFWSAAVARVATRATLSHGVMAVLARYHWPGNVRELQNVLAALAVDAPLRGQVRAARLPAAIAGASVVTSGRLSEARMQWERRFVEVALARAGGSRTRAARDLGLTRQGLLKVLTRLGLAAATSLPA